MKRSLNRGLSIAVKLHTKCHLYCQYFLGKIPRKYCQKMKLTDLPVLSIQRNSNLPENPLKTYRFLGKFEFRHFQFIRHFHILIVFWWNFTHIFLTDSFLYKMPFSTSSSSSYIGNIRIHIVPPAVHTDGSIYASLNWN